MNRKKLLLLTTLLAILVQISNAQTGKPDAAFGNNGIAKTGVGSSYPYSLAGQQVLAKSNGDVYIMFTANGQTVVSKKHSEGSADSTYGTGGFSISVPILQPHATLQTDGKLVIAGLVSNVESENRTDCALARLNADGSIDSTFGNNGIQVSDFGNDDRVNALTIQPDGKIIAVGFFDGFAYLIARYNTDGKLDQTFNSAGFTAVRLGDNIDQATYVALQTDGKIVAGGSIALVRLKTDGAPDSSFNGSSVKYLAYDAHCIAIQSDNKILIGSSADYNFDIARYNTDGSSDSSFGSDGFQQTDFGGFNNLPASIFIQTDGKIIMQGLTWGNTYYGKDIAIARYNINGSPDSSYSGDGKQTISPGLANSFAFVSIQSNGKLLVLSNALDLLTLQVAKYNLSGTPDKSFGKKGKLTDHLSQQNTVYTSIAVQNNGKVVAVGYAWNKNNYVFALARYDTNGSLDHTFSGDGKLFIDISSGDDEANSVAIQSNGKIVVGGSAGGKIGIVRRNQYGGLDSTFNGNGKVISDFFSNLTSVKIQPDGKILVAGSGLARFNADGTPDVSFNGIGEVATPFNCNDIAIQKDGKIIVVGNNSAARFNSNGSPDLTFGNPGTGAQDYIPDTDGTYFLNSAAIQSDGKIVLGGYLPFTDKGINRAQFTILRTDTNGIPDLSYSENGSTLLSPGQLSYATSLAIQNDDKIILAGYVYNGSNRNFALARLNTEGNLDTTFNSNGIQITPVSLSDNEIQHIVIAKNKLYAAGYARYSGNFGVVVKYLLNSNNPPIVNLIAPANNATYPEGANVFVAATASDVDGAVRKVEFYKGTTLLHTSIDTPYSFNWQHVAKGSYTLTAKAADDSGHTTISAAIHINVVPITPPSVSITEPSYQGENYIAPGPILLRAVASARFGTIKSVDFYSESTFLFSDSTAPYTGLWQSVPTGSFYITAVATDNNGLKGTSPAVHIHVLHNRPPSVAVTSPVNGSTYAAPAAIIVSADAVAQIGSIKVVNFYSGTTLIHTKVSPPYSWTWENVTAGTDTITAVATDSYGRTTISSPVAITVTSPDSPLVSNRSSFADIKTGLNKEDSLQLSPNPASNILNIYTSGLQKNGRTAISIISASGVLFQTKQFNNLTPTIQLNISSLAGGIYIIKMVSADKVMYKQFVKL